jgi:hypothetical protein
MLVESLIIQIGRWRQVLALIVLAVNLQKRMVRIKLAQSFLQRIALSCHTERLGRIDVRPLNPIDSYVLLGMSLLPSFCLRLTTEISLLQLVNQASALGYPTYHLNHSSYFGASTSRENPKHHEEIAATY